MPKSIVSTGGFNYDLNSLMHYGPYSFPILDDQPTIMPKPCVDMGMYDIDRNDATPNDIAEINALYKCNDSKCKNYFCKCWLNSKANRYSFITKCLWDKKVSIEVL